MKFFIHAVVLLSIAGCSKPMAKFIVSHDEYEAPARIKFENKSQNSDSYEWDFGDGNFSSEISPEHSYILSGAYNVSVKSIRGDQESTFEKKIHVKAPDFCQILIQTSEGDMMLRLNDNTPYHRDNFINLVESDYYRGVTFHRVIDGFVIQAGEPNPENRIKVEESTIPAEISKKLRHYTGALSAARMPDDVNPEKQSNRTQFYIVDKSRVTEDHLKKAESKNSVFYSSEEIEKYLKEGGAPQLDGEYTVFGYLISGYETLEKISQAKTKAGNRPEKDIIINKMIMIR